MKVLSLFLAPSRENLFCDLPFNEDFKVFFLYALFSFPSGTSFSTFLFSTIIGFLDRPTLYLSFSVLRSFWFSSSLSLPSFFSFLSPSRPGCLVICSHAFCPEAFFKPPTVLVPGSNKPFASFFYFFLPRLQHPWVVFPPRRKDVLPQFVPVLSSTVCFFQLFLSLFRALIPFSPFPFCFEKPHSFFFWVDPTHTLFIPSPPVG